MTEEERIRKLELAFVEIANDVKWLKYLVAAGSSAGVFQVLLGVIKSLQDGG